MGESEQWRGDPAPEVKRARRRTARFPVFAALDRAGGAGPGIVEIDRDSGLVTVRAARKRRRYVMRLADVADMICKRIIMGEVAEKLRARKKRGKTRR